MSSGIPPNVIAAILLTERDGRERWFAEQSGPAPWPMPVTPPPVTPPPVTPPPVEPPVVTPPPVIPSPADPAYANQLTIRPGDDVAAKFLAIKPSTIVNVQAGEYRHKLPFNLPSVSDVLIRAIGAVTLWDDDDGPNEDGLRCHIGVGGSSRNIVIDGIRYYSPDALGMKMANGVNVSGDGVTVRNCIFDGCYQGVLVANKADGVKVHANKFLRAVYANYFNGTNGLFENNVCERGVEHAFMRANEFNGLVIRRNTLRGHPTSTITTPARITIQSGENATIADNDLTDTFISVFPLSTNTGLNGVGGDVAIYQAVRTRNVKILDNVFHGRGNVTIGNRTENITYVGRPEPVVDVHGNLTNQYPAVKLVGAKNVTVNGVKVA